MSGGFVDRFGLLSFLIFEQEENLYRRETIGGEDTPYSNFSSRKPSFWRCITC